MKYLVWFVVSRLTTEPTATATTTTTITSNTAVDTTTTTTATTYNTATLLCPVFQVCKHALIPLYLALESVGFRVPSRNIKNFCAIVVSPRNGPSVRCASVTTVVYKVLNVPGTCSFNLNNVT